MPANPVDSTVQQAGRIHLSSIVNAKHPTAQAGARRPALQPAPPAAVPCISTLADEAHHSSGRAAQQQLLHRLADFVLIQRGGAPAGRVPQAKP